AVSGWSRGEELVNDAFPDVVSAASVLSDGIVVDGEILAWSAADDRPFEFAALQKRLNRKAPSPKLTRDIPAVLAAYDVLEQNGIDVRTAPFRERRTRLAGLLPPSSAIRISPLLSAIDWPALSALRARSREYHAEGLMLKKLDSPYGVGRVRGPWWKGQIDPYSVDAVMIYAQAGHGRRASLFTDYTFAVWSDGELVPFAKAYSGLSDAEIRDVDAWVRGHTIER